MSDDPKVPQKPDHLPEGDVPSASGSDSGSVAPFDSGDKVSPEDAARWRRPEERFPMLPEEAPPPTAPLKDPPRPRPTPPRSSGRHDTPRNLIALFFLLASCLLITYFAVIWQNPYSALNPLAPPTPLPRVLTATLTPTDTLTPSPTDTPSPTLTPSPIPSIAPTATFTPVFIQGFSTAAATGTVEVTENPASYTFALKPNHVVYLTNPDARGGCKWSSIGGTVMNYDGTALDGYGVHVYGNGVDQTVGTGSATGMGPGGFEVPLGNVARDAEYVAQLVDPQGNPVSPVYTVDTKSDCTLNIAILRFVATTPATPAS